MLISTNVTMQNRTHTQIASSIQQYSKLGSNSLWQSLMYSTLTHVVIVLHSECSFDSVKDSEDNLEIWKKVCIRNYSTVSLISTPQTGLFRQR